MLVVAGFESQVAQLNAFTGHRQKLLQSCTRIARMVTVGMGPKYSIVVDW